MQIGIVSIHGEENINELATTAMKLTLQFLEQQRLLTPIQVDEFIKTHMCVMANQNPLKRIVNKLFSKVKPEEMLDNYLAIVKLEAV